MKETRSKRPGGIVLGRAFGVRLTVEWSFLLIFVLVVMTLVSVFSRWHPSWTLTARITLAVTAAVAFVVSLVGHELAHAVVARKLGVPVHDLRLFLLGGASELEHEPPTARAELLIAIAGPLVSFVIGRLCIGGALLLAGSLQSRGPLSTVLVWLGPVNVVLGAFNLVPAFPLDGGRVLRAALWAITRDLAKATRWASSVGQLAGWSFVVLGVAIIFGARVPFFGAGPVSGMWLVFIGIFITNAARRTYETLVIEGSLAGLTVRRLMRTQGDVIAPHASLSDAAGAFLRSREHMFPVVENETFVGLLTLEDLSRAAREGWATTPVSRVMTPAAKLVVAAPDENVTTALRRLTRAGVAQLPVVEGRRLLGVLEAIAVERWLEMQTPFRAMQTATGRGSPLPGR